MVFLLWNSRSVGTLFTAAYVSIKDTSRFLNGFKKYFRGFSPKKKKKKGKEKEKMVIRKSGSNKSRRRIPD